MCYTGRNYEVTRFCCLLMKTFGRKLTQHIIPSCLPPIPTETNPLGGQFMTGNFLRKRNQTNASR